MTAVPARGYAICAVPRSGSNLLCRLLTDTGVLGRPLEYFNGPARRTLDHPGYPDEPEAQVAAIRTLGATPNGVYGLKLFPEQFRAAQHVRWTEALPNLSFVRLERRDRLGQALSWARALQTGQYRSTSSATGDAAYDPALIQQCLGRIVRDEARWRLWFARTGIEALSLEYETVAADPVAAVRAVAALVGVDAPDPDMSRIELRPQRDAGTERWRQRFLSERGDPATIEPEHGPDGLPDPAWTSICPPHPHPRTGR